MPLPPPASADDTEVCDAFPSPAATITWSMVNGSARLVADVEPGLTLEVEAAASLGGLTHRWTQGPYTPDGAGHAVVQLSVPAAAFLDDDALDYVTILRVSVVAIADDREQYTVRAPPAFLAWPNGAGAAAVVWDRATQAAEAPNGVLSEVVRGAFGELGADVWIASPRHTSPSARE